MKCLSCGKLFSGGKKLTCSRRCASLLHNSGKHQTIIEKKYNDYRLGAKTRGISFELTPAMFGVHWQKPCSYCGAEIKTVGLDRVDSSIGYTESNVTPCCSMCNWMKLKKTAQQYVDHCVRVAKHCGCI